MSATPPFPDPAAPLPGEADFLARVVADLPDDTPKLVYADWLEERGDPRGPFLRRFVAAYRDGTPLPDPGAFPKPWRDLTGITLAAGLRVLGPTGLGPKADTLFRLARPAVRVTAERTDDHLPVGASKFGGQPDLPAGVDWPGWDRGPLGFLGQFRLADLAPSPAGRDLPPAGLLSVFYDADGEVFGDGDPGGWRVLHLPDEGLARREEPPDLSEWNWFTPCRLAFAETLTLPGDDSPWADELALSGDYPAYRDLTHRPEFAHQLLGYPNVLQNDVLGSKERRLLLSLDSEEAPGWAWGDVGLLYFTIRADDLAARRFDRVGFEMQCS